MRNHKTIITEVGTGAVATIVGVSPNTVKGWKLNDSIPGKHWRALVMAGKASWDELGEAAARKAGVSPVPVQQVAA